MKDKDEQLNFSGLVEAIRQVHEHCASHAGKAINVSLTLRNWVIGYYILEYEQRGADRADYGERLIESLSDRLQHVGMSRVEPRELRRYRQFYLVYSRIWESLTPELRRLSSDIGLPVPEIRDSPTPEFVLAGNTLITSLLFTHLSELIQSHHACTENFLSANSRYGRGKRDLVSNINWFMNVPIEEDGTLGIVDGISAPGLYVDLRAAMDLTAVISNCPQINNPCNGFNPTPLRVIISGRS